MKGTWKTDSHGSGVLLLAVIVAAVGVAGGAAVAGPVVRAADAVLHIVLITVAALAGLGVALGALALVLAARARRHPPAWTAQVLPPRRAPQRAVQSRTAAQGVLPPQIHLHLHGPVSAADVAELIARQGKPQPAAIEEDK